MCIRAAMVSRETGQEELRIEIKKLLTKTYCAYEN